MICSKIFPHLQLITSKSAVTLSQRPTHKAVENLIEKASCYEIKFTNKVEEHDSTTNATSDWPWI